MSTRYSDTSPEMLRIDPDDDPRSLGPAAAGVRLWAALAVAAIAVAGFGGVVAYGYLAYADRGASAPAPLIKADEKPIKTRPDNPGGMEVPHQDKDIFAVGGRDAGAAKRGGPTTETLLPLPEAPLPRPTPQPVIQAVAASPGQPATASEAAAQSAAAVRPAASSEPEPLISTGPPPFPAPRPPPAAPAPRLASLQPHAAASPHPITPTSGVPAAAAAPTSVTPIARTAAAPAVAATGRYRIQVGAMRSEAEARDAWEKVRRKHPDVVGALSASYTRVDLQGRGEFYRVHVGPLPDVGAAREACARLAKGGTGCIVVPPS